MYLDEVKKRCEELQIVHAEKIRPCTEDEVHTLERQLGFSLPGAYKEFLLWMGHGAGILLRGSDCFYQHLPHLRTWAEELLEENSFPEPLPEDAFVFFMHQGYQFNFLHMSEGDDPPVHFYGEWTKQSSFTIIYRSFSDFLSAEIEDCAKTLAEIAKSVADRLQRDPDIIKRDPGFVRRMAEIAIHDAHLLIIVAELVKDNSSLIKPLQNLAKSDLRVAEFLAEMKKQHF